MAGSTPLMFTSGRAIIDGMVRAIGRSLTFLGVDDTDIYEWLLDNPDVNSISQLPNDTIPALLANRILTHQTISASWSIPLQQQIDFETPSQVLGIEGLLVAASVLYNIAYRMRMISLPMPDYNPQNFRPTLLADDSISIAFIFQRKVAGRLDGYTLSGPSFLWKAASTFGLTTNGDGMFPHSDELYIQFPDRAHILGASLITDFRRFHTPLDSFSGFMSTIQVVYHGLGFIRTCSLNEAVMCATETFFATSRIPAQISAWTLIETLR